MFNIKQYYVNTIISAFIYKNAKDYW